MSVTSVYEVVVAQARRVDEGLGAGAAGEGALAAVLPQVRADVGAREPCIPYTIHLKFVYIDKKSYTLYLDLQLFYL